LNNDINNNQNNNAVEFNNSDDQLQIYNN